MSTKLTDKSSIEQILQEMSLEEKAMLVTGGSPFAGSRHIPRSMESPVR